MIVAALSDDISTYRGDSAKVQASWDRVRDGQIQAGRASDSIAVVQPDDFARLKGYDTSEMFRSDLRHYQTGFVTDFVMSLYQLAKLPNGIKDINGGSGQDKLVYDGRHHAFIDGGGGVDTLAISMGARSLSVVLTDAGTGKLSSSAGTFQIGLGSVERLSTSSGHDRVQLGGSVQHVDAAAGRDTVQGSARGDTICLGADADVGYGHDGRDRLYGGDGNDSLHGGNDADLLQGQNGRDFLDLGSGNDTGLGGGGNDTILGAAGKIFWMAETEAICLPAEAITTGWKGAPATMSWMGAAAMTCCGAARAMTPCWAAAGRTACGPVPEMTFCGADRGRIN